MSELTLEDLNARITDLETEASNAENRTQVLHYKSQEYTLRLRALEEEVKDMLYTLDKLTNPNLYN
jgi:hypothetical protein